MGKGFGFEQECAQVGGDNEQLAAVICEQKDAKEGKSRRSIS